MDIIEALRKNNEVIKDKIDALSATDVQIAGQSITADGVANIPIASTTKYGAVKVDGALSPQSTNPVQNKAVVSAITSRVAVVAGKGLSTNDYTDDDKAKVDALPDDLDGSLSTINAGLSELITVNQTPTEKTKLAVETQEGESVKLVEQSDLDEFEQGLLELRNENSRLSESITEIKNNIFGSEETFQKNTSSFIVEANKTIGYDSMPATQQGHVLFSTTLDSDGKIYFDTTDLTGFTYVAFAYEHSGVLSTRYRNTDSNLPTLDNTISLQKGDTIFIAGLYYEYSAKGEMYYHFISQSGNLISDFEKKIKALVDVDVISATEYRISFGEYSIPFKKTVASSIRANLWNFGGLTRNGTEIFADGTDIIGVLKENGQSDFMGGVHGDETNVEMVILCDGKPVTSNVSGRYVDIFMHSHLTRVSTGENVIDRYVHIKIGDNKIDISTTFECLVDNFSVYIAYNGGMFAWYRNDINTIYTSVGKYDISNPVETYGAVKDLNSVSVCLNDNSVIDVENINGHSNNKYDGTIIWYKDEPRPRLKVYYATEKQSTWNKGHICVGHAVYSFRS